MKTWNGKDLDGEWVITYKIDGVRAIVLNDGDKFCALSRAGKPLYNLEAFPSGIYEVFGGSWEKSVSAVRTKVDGEPVPLEWGYRLDQLDPRLFVCTAVNPSADLIAQLMKKALRLGFEGLVLHPAGKAVMPSLEDCLKVKPKETHDVAVTGIQPGTGKHEGRMGALLTERGKVGTGFTDAQREDWTKGANGCVIGATIEVEAMGLTPKGKFRHARFLRLREDK